MRAARSAVGAQPIVQVVGERLCTRVVDLALRRRGPVGVAAQGADESLLWQLDDRCAARRVAAGRSSVLCRQAKRVAVGGGAVDELDATQRFRELALERVVPFDDDVNRVRDLRGLRRLDAGDARRALLLRLRPLAKRLL